MPFLIPAAIAIGSSIGAGLAAAGTALGVAAGALAAGNLALAGSALLAVGDASLIGSFTVGSVLEIGALAGVSALLMPHPKVNTAGSPQQFKPDPNAGIPVVMGRYGVGGNLVYETTSGGSNSMTAGAKGNEYLTHFVILSGLGPIQQVETLRFNDTILVFSGQNVTGGYIPQDEVQHYNPGYEQNSNGSYENNNFIDHAWQNLQLGALNAGHLAYPDKLNTESDAPLPEWTTAHGFSSFAASALTVVYDQTIYAGGVPERQWTLQGIKLYDPRKDSTYPGGAGSHRWAGQGATAAAITAARATWEYTTNPFLHALNFAMGHYLPDGSTTLGRLYAGLGGGTTGVDIASFVFAANVADANGWTICGQWTTDDGKWSVLTEMLKAGSGAPVIDRGLISCLVDTPLASLGSVTADDLSGPITFPTGASFTARINTIFPRYSSEAHRWQMVQADTPVKAATYVAEDGMIRSKTMDWQYVPTVNQACQLAAYTITNGREIASIELPGKPKLRNYTVGDCFTLDVPEAGLAATKVKVTKRLTDPMTGGVTLTVRTETDAKHAYSLGVSGVAPPTPGISGFDPSIVEAPLPSAWAAAVTQVTDPTGATGEATFVIRINGSTIDNVYAAHIIVEYRQVYTVDGSGNPLTYSAWTSETYRATTTQIDLDLNPGAYQVILRYSTVNGAENVNTFLNLGLFTVAGSAPANASVTTAKVATFAITNSATAEDTSSVPLGALNAAPVQIGSLAYIATGAPIRLDVVAEILNTDTTHDQNIKITVQRDGTAIGRPFNGFVRQNSAGVSGGWPGQMQTFFFDTGVSAGSHTWTVFAQNTAGAGGACTKDLSRICLLELKDQV